ncbi:MAG: glycosyltransferase [Clostridia bacterium]|nr:glycosyltransferase [Clostridia bacterium]
MKALILSCNTGQGHNTAARAILEELTARGIECEMQDALAFASQFISDTVCGIYNKAAVHIPRVLGAGISVAKGIARIFKKDSPCYVANLPYANKVYRYIKENGFDTIIMPHVFPSEALTWVERRLPNEDDLRTCFIATDYAYPPFLSETELDIYFIPHEDLRETFVEAGVPRDKIVVSGIPVSSAFRAPTTKEEAREALGLPQDKRILLVMTGSMGYGNTGELTARLLERLPENTLVYVMGGNNEKMKAAIRAAHAGDERLTVLDFTDKVSLYLAASDLLFTKPGGLSSTEAAVRGIPVLHTKPIPGWEQENIAFFREHGLSDHGENAEALVTKALFLLANPHRGEEMVENQRKHINAFAARDIVDHLLKTEPK